MSYRFLKMAAIESEIYFGFGFSDITRLEMFKFICTPNFDELSQSTAEIFLLPVCENDRPPYWILLPVSFSTYLPSLAWHSTSAYQISFKSDWFHGLSDHLA